jgi:hypothetical protein
MFPPIRSAGISRSLFHGSIVGPPTPLTPIKIRPLPVPRCTSFASPPYLAEAMIQKNAVIDPEQITILRRELVRQCVATLQSPPAGAHRHRQSHLVREGVLRIPGTLTGQKINRTLGNPEGYPAGRMRGIDQYSPNSAGFCLRIHHWRTYQPAPISTMHPAPIRAIVASGTPGSGRAGPAAVVCAAAIDPDADAGAPLPAP